MVGEEIKVLDHGFVRLDSANATDLSVVNSARVSVGVKHHTLLADDEKLIGFLMRERHGTPFEHNSFTFHVKAPLFVVREWQRHRIGSYNELSGRYKQFENPDFYFPEPEAMRTQLGKPGAYTFEQWKGPYKRMQSLYHRHYQDSLELYEYAIEQGVAKEVARLALPLSLYTEMYWTVNARSLMNFLSLRNADQAMFEIRSYAKVIEELFQDEMPFTHQHFLANNRVAP